MKHVTLLERPDAQNPRPYYTSVYQLHEKNQRYIEFFDPMVCADEYVATDRPGVELHLVLEALDLDAIAMVVEVEETSRGTRVIALLY